jgi:hypothetical protein
MAEADVEYLGSATLADNHPALVLDAAAAEAVARLGTARQRQLAIDFAVNQRFRRDIFVRRPAESEPATERHLYASVVGSLSPESLGTKVKVPRGEVSFQEDFIRELRALMLRGSMTVGEIVASLSKDGRKPHEIARNITFLVAGGALTPFARAYTPNPAVKPSRPANALVARTLADAIDRNAPRMIPSEVVGNGVAISAAEAFGVLQLPGGDSRNVARHVIENVWPNLIRLGLIV